METDLKHYGYAPNGIFYGQKPFMLHK